MLTAILLNRVSKDYPRLLQVESGSISMFAGTSTGAILAPGLAAGWSPAQIRDLYVVNGKIIFDSSWDRDVVEMGGLTGAKYDKENLRRVLQETFEGKRLKDLNARVSVPSFRLDNIEVDPAKQTWSPTFFHNFPGPDSDGECSLVDVAMATGAAPPYFPSYN